MGGALSGSKISLSADELSVVKHIHVGERIGLDKKRTKLWIQQVPLTDKRSNSFVKDLNRARNYLKDAAVVAEKFTVYDNLEHVKNQSRKASSPGTRIASVFLGGSCGTTTWRSEVVIPALKEMGFVDHSELKVAGKEDTKFAFYNPQSVEWNSEQVLIERHLKQVAPVLVFVIDNLTRAMASMVEVAVLAPILRREQLGRHIILVVRDFEQTQVKGDSVSPEETEELNSARQCLRNIAGRYPDVVRVMGSVQDVAACVGELVAGRASMVNIK